MDLAVYRTLKAALELKMEQINKVDRYYEENPDQQFFDLESEVRKVELKKCLDARSWLIEQKRAGLVK